MANRPEVRTLSLDKTDHAEQWSALSALAADLELGGNVSSLARWLADVYQTAPAATVAMLKAAGSIANGGDEWSTLVALRDYLPAVELSVENR